MLVSGRVTHPSVFLLKPMPRLKSPLLRHCLWNLSPNSSPPGIFPLENSEKSKKRKHQRKKKTRDWGTKGGGPGSLSQYFQGFLHPRWLALGFLNMFLTKQDFGWLWLLCRIIWDGTHFTTSHRFVTHNHPYTLEGFNMEPREMEVWFRWFSFANGWFLGEPCSFPRGVSLPMHWN